MQSVTNLYLLNLAIADLLTLCAGKIIMINSLITVNQFVKQFKYPQAIINNQQTDYQNKIVK